MSGRVNLPSPVDTGTVHRDVRASYRLRASSADSGTPAADPADRPTRPTDRAH